MSDNKRVDEPTGTETVGHEWDGIEELNTPLPRWWLWTFYATIAFSVAYMVAYPAIPLLSNATAGTLGWSSRGQLAQEMTTEVERRAPLMRALTSTPLIEIAATPDLNQAAIEGGRAAFRVHCVQCHGTGAAGTTGYPNLNDDDWLWGGDLTAIRFSLEHGIRNPDHDQTRMSLMPAFGRDGILTAPQIDDVVSHVRVLAGSERPSASATRGAEFYSANCAVCHGSAGEGDRTVGAPRLSDPIWLYGGSRAALTQSVSNSRQGVMPRWGNRLDPVTINMLTLYVHSLGGGEAEASPQPAAEPAPAVIAAAR
jgi:cytochrome c oxidase cbb3-type subunit III